MSFNVTQCPACESTFNTNSRVLAAAAGKVRCGACLNVFEAIDHFLIPDTGGETALEQGESVFVGNNPQEFFDPSRFLTRAALTEPSNNESAVIDSLDEQDLHDELERSEAVSEDFFVSVAEELHGNHDNDNISAIEDKFGIENDAYRFKQPYETTGHTESETIDAHFEEEILESFDALAQASPEQSVPEKIEPDIDTEPTFYLPQVSDLETEVEAEAEAESLIDEDLAAGGEGEEVEQDTTKSFAAEQSQAISNRPFVGMEISASFSYDPRLAVKTQETDPADAAAPEKEPGKEQEVQSEAVAADAERFNENEEQFFNAINEGLEQSSQSETGDTSAENSSIDVAPVAIETQSIETESIEKQSTDSPETLAFEELPREPVTNNLKVPENDGPAQIDPPSAVAPSLEENNQPENIAVLEEQASTNSDQLQEKEVAEDSAEEDDWPDENAVVEEQTNTDTEQTLREKADEDSTETIRARALETELSDEQALESIPEENLAALGNMSTTLELLSRKESRLLRNILMSLTIVILGGLLSGQYLWQRMELYSQLPQLRPVYETACTLLNCDLPEYTDLDSIRSENLTVRTHPTFSNGLMVNTVIRNTAAFGQPFPLLILSFNSAANGLIALREFSPSEYLDPGLRSIQLMPSRTPIQVGLAIMDPGPEAVNYTLAFRWP